MTRALFDRDEIIDKSIELFWQNGYSASTMQRVVKATGLKPGSIYLAFGNKEGLFRESLESYADSNLAWMADVLESTPDAEEAIFHLLRSIIDESGKKDYRSCFLLKTQLELAAEGNELYQFAAAKLAEVEKLLQTHLEKLYDQPTSQQRATSLMLHIFGIRVYGYRRGSADRIWNGLRAGLPWLPWDQNS